MTQLQKARLFCTDSSDLDFEFMFNPDTLQFKESISVGEDESAVTDEGRPKVSFEYPNARTLSLKKAMFDTYETGKNIMTEYLDKLRSSLMFAGYSTGSTTTTTNSSGATTTTTKDTTTTRPPIYRFVWGDQDYLICFVEKLDYKLTMFLPDGTPVRAEVNLSLKEIDDSFLASTSRSYDSELFGDRDTRTQPPAAVSLDKANQIVADNLATEAANLTSAATKLQNTVVNWKDGRNDLSDAQFTLDQMSDAEYTATLESLGLSNNLSRAEAAQQIHNMNKDDLQSKVDAMNESAQAKTAEANQRRTWG